MIKNILLFICTALSGQIYSQNSYTGEFSKDQYYIGTETTIPFGTHTSHYDKDELTISIVYDDLASFTSLIVVHKSDTLVTKKLDFPGKTYDWVKITDGLWIDSIGKNEKHVTSYKESDEINVHYAGFLESGDPFDNSFIRNRPLNSSLKHYMRGFSIGVVNVKPGTVRIIKISPELAYGSKGYGNIPPNSTLYYIIYNIGINGE